MIALRDVLNILIVNLGEVKVEENNNDPSEWSAEEWGIFIEDSSSLLFAYPEVAHHIYEKVILPVSTILSKKLLLSTIKTGK